jgi:hypothetical protein
VRWARFAFNLVAWLFVAAVVLQVYFAGQGVFVRFDRFETHVSWGYTFGLLVLVFPILALVGRLPRRYLGASLLLFVLFALQSVFIVLWKSTPPNGAVAALHPLNGFAILVLSIWMAWTTRSYLRVSSAAPQRITRTAEPASDNPAA